MATGRGERERERDIEVIVTKAKLVKPAKGKPILHLWTSNIDHVVVQAHASTVYLYPFHVPLCPSSPPSQKDEKDHAAATDDGCAIPNTLARSFFDWDALEVALAEVLVEFYPVAGRLKKDGSDGGRIGIECNDEGVMLVEAVAADATFTDFGGFNDIGDFIPTRSLQPLAPHVASSEDIGSCPLLLLQVTRFRCGGVSLGVKMHHHVADGMSGMHFINTWAKMVQRKLKPEIGYAMPVPFLDRSLLKARCPPSPNYPHIEYQPPLMLMEPDAKSHAFVNEPIVVSTFRLGPDQLKALKCLAVADGSSSYTTYEVLSSHIWRCISKARALQPKQQTMLYMAINGRSRMWPPLPDGYFGNAIFRASPISSMADLTSHPLSYGADLIRQALARIDNDYIISSLDYLQLHPSLGKLVHGAHTFGLPNLGITSWVNLGMYDADFGWGHPIFMGPATIPFEGLVYVFSSPSRDGSLYISLRLFAHHMDAFKFLLYQI